jgi:hypothetical protein
MPGWTQNDVDRRNLEVFGNFRPDGPAAPPERPAKDVPESLIAMECEQLLREDGWRTLRCEPVSDRSRGRGFGEVGMPDLLAIRYGRKLPTAEVLWLEHKRPGQKPKKHQHAWHSKERARGALVWVANETFPATVAGFREHYAQSGLMRRPKWW